MKKTKVMFMLGIVVGLASVSAKACDGPVVVPGYTAGSCVCSNYDTTSGTGTCNPSGITIGYRNTYTTCGGDGYTSCTIQNQTVGYVNPGCVATINVDKEQIDLRYYDDCIDPNNPPGLICTFEFCDFSTCSMDTTGATGTPINKDVEVSLGDDCGG